ncbi:MAG: oxygen-independent coproporphyrinogen III oxidase [Pseudobdellovibrio sp.]
MSHSFHDLLKKYDVPVPRYTSYPTVPAWKETPNQDEWIKSVKASLKNDNDAWSMYIHLPFCESLCTFCGCNTIITKDHKKSDPYVDLVLKEWSLYLSLVPELAERELKHIHLGGGSPTFLSADELTRLISTLFSKIKIAQNNFEASIEVDPRRTSKEQLLALRKLGFNRVSMGVQDFNPEVQRIIHRVQPFEITEKLTQEARELGYDSVNFDLIYGLPLQTKERMISTIEQTLKLRPDRIAFYSFALVPWIKPAQRLFKDSDLPLSEEKRDLYEVAREMFLKAGYQDIGMDHFALPTDLLYKAREEKTLHRNFMGYTDQKTNLLLGLGISSISESLDQFHQNEKLLPKYQEMIEDGKLATHRGHILTERDVAQKKKILQMMTQYEYRWANSEEYQNMKNRFLGFEQEGLISLNDQGIKVLDKGHPFLRNVCSKFDDYLPENKNNLFSKSI